MSEVTMRQDLLALMREVYPERCDYVGDAALDRVIDRGAAVADGLGLDKTRGAALCVLMLFQLGHGCFDDPLFPWVPLAVRSLTGDDPPSRTAQLERKAMTYLDLIARRLAAAH